MTEEELSRIVESKLADRLAARLQADREAVRLEVIREIVREQDRAHYTKINSRAPIQDRLAGLTAEQDAERQRIMRENAARTYAEMDEAERAGRERVAAMRTPRASISPGSEGFEIKRGGA